MGLAERVLLGLSLAIFLSPDSFALIPPEVPQSRSYEVFSPVIFLSTGPTYFGEDIVTSSGPACLGYQEVVNVRQTLSPSLVPTAKLSNYKSVLQTPAGIYYAISHAATTRDFTVEMYENSPAGANAAQSALNSYVASGVVSIGDAYVAQTSDSHFAIWVRGAFIQKVQTAANARHDIALHLGCNSYSAGLAFVNSKHLVRNFLGAVNTIWLDVNPSHPYDVTNAVLNNMAGIRNDIGQGYKNATFAVGSVAALQAYPQIGIQGDNAPPFPANMRLYNAPRVILVR